jgi:hypothetical protein
MRTTEGDGEVSGHFIRIMKQDLEKASHKEGVVYRAYKHKRKSWVVCANASNCGVYGWRKIRLADKSRKNGGNLPLNNERKK